MKVRLLWPKIFAGPLIVWRNPPYIAGKRSASVGKFGFPTGALFFQLFLPHLRQEIPHRLSCPILLLAGGMGVGPQSESGVAVPGHGGDRLDVHAVLEGQETIGRRRRILI